VYVNSGHLLWDLPDELADVGDRFKAWCDTNSSARWYINKYDFRQSTDTYPDRQYMFCYARFILQEYSLRYGELIDSWIFDTASYMTKNGDLQKLTKWLSNSFYLKDDKHGTHSKIQCTEVP
ncbi:hypothetical protein N8878_08635, partial [Psychromonas sp.]|nr:hypothetical protein [Psychromonas sp.]